MDSTGDDHGDHSKPARLVTFGSVIHLNSEDDFTKFLYSEGRFII